MMKKYLTIIFCVLGFISPNANCIQQGKNKQYTPLKDKDLRNATYVDVNYGTVHLKNGEFIINDENDLKGDLRFIAKGDLDGDGNEDAVCILFSYQGGNDPDETLCAVINNHGKPKVVVCQALNEYATSVRIEKGIIIIEICIYVEGDAHCCPSKRDIIKYILNGNKLEKIK